MVVIVAIRLETTVFVTTTVIITSMMGVIGASVIRWECGINSRASNDCMSSTVIMSVFNNACRQQSNDGN